MNLNFSPVRFGSGDPTKAQAAMRRQISNDEIAKSDKLSNDVFQHGALIETEAVNPRKMSSPQVSQALRNIINKNKERDLGT